MSGGGKENGGNSLFLAGDFAVKKETNEMPISGFLPFGGLHQLKILKRSTGLRVPLPIGPGGGRRTYPPGKVNELDTCLVEEI
ncbi:hypothetical protein GBA52_002946 [Prunus armeniaca]|nr:hypothetical protein GBA52_002946 [Prunus armeniaca]